MMRQVQLIAPLSAAPMAADLEVADAPIPACPEDGVLIKVAAISVDPYVGAAMRGRHMGYTALPAGGVPPGHGVGLVIESRNAAYPIGAWVVAETGWREIAAAPASAIFRTVTPGDLPLSYQVGVLGMPGLTGFAGAVRLGGARAGDTVLVSAATGPVGSAFGQIARIKGANKVVGIAGGPEKCKTVVDAYGFDACIDYKAEGWREAIKEAAPEGYSLYIENVGADMFAAAINALAINGRMIICGLAAHYQADGPPASTLMGPIVGKRAHVMGLVVYDFYGEHAAYAAEALTWVKDGRLKTLEDAADGLAEGPALLERLMTGKNVGKAVIKLWDGA
jgi:NADPH-dependent curcumin reductase